MSSLSSYCSTRSLPHVPSKFLWSCFVTSCFLLPLCYSPAHFFLPAPSCICNSLPNPFFPSSPLLLPAALLHLFSFCSLKSSVSHSFLLTNMFFPSCSLVFPSACHSVLLPFSLLPHVTSSPFLPVPSKLRWPDYSTSSSLLAPSWSLVAPLARLRYTASHSFLPSHSLFHYFVSH